MAFPLAGKVAVVTGSSRSIGEAVVRRLAADGANVIVNYVSDASAAQSVVDSINAYRPGAGRAISVQADAASVKGGEDLVDAAFQYYGALDILVLCAGYADGAALAEATEEVFDKHFAHNVKGPLFTAKAAAPRMKAGGRIIFFSSQVTRNSMITPTYLVYNATKGAVEQMTRVLAKDLGARGITVNAVAPGPVDTEMFRKGKSEELIGRMTSLHPGKRLGLPDDIAPVVAFLARDDAGWVNGHILMANGGFTV
ncbi:hypothetical protein B0H21DRAFT_706028 [Amylocystis lapponica]|nr:hypothetical protein B0H21DRAFT_706028 [Amylocystis lapponica]